MKVVSRNEWESMLSHSRRLLSEAELQKGLGNMDEYRAIWGELGPLNRLIRNNSLLRVKGIDA